MASPTEDRIEVLPQALVEKIAAGEVIERPGSVVKELVENALDAGAGRITVEAEDAGFALIAVADNGRGMSADNLGRAVLSHATSKIRALDDLYALHTMGFRGEALASIAAVSRIEICTSDSDEGLAHTLVAEGGSVQGLQQGARSRGTTVCVRDLFFNTPARRKFMKSRTAERMHLSRLMEQLAAPFPAVHFVLKLDGVVALDASPVAGVRERISQCAGPGFAAGLIECSGEFPGAHLTVLLSPPESSSSRARFQDLYVNLRRVDCDTVTFAIRNACSSFYPSGTRPSFFAFIDIDPSRVDVNIHPTKQRVKFGDERQVGGAVFHAVEKALGASFAPAVPVPAASPPESSPGPIVHRSSPDISASGSPVVSVRESGQAALSESSQVRIAFPGTQPEAATARSAGTPGSGPGQAESWDLITCFQIHGLFIVAPIAGGILLVDQHAAHERVLFEQALDDLDHGASASQQLLFPVVVELAPSEKALLDSRPEVFRKLGYEFGDFGGSAVSVSAIPAYIRPGHVEETIRDTIGFLLSDTEAKRFPDDRERFAAAFACGSAIKAGQELTREEMSALLNSLFAARSPYTCPHGRPTLTRLSLDELKRRFLR